MGVDGADALPGAPWGAPSLRNAGLWGVGVGGGGHTVHCSGPGYPVLRALSHFIRQTLPLAPGPQQPSSVDAHIMFGHRDSHKKMVESNRVE